MQPAALPVRSRQGQGQEQGADLPILEAVLPSNRIQMETVRNRIKALEPQAAVMLGLSFKPGTDDLRESPLVELVRCLREDGIQLSVHDPDVNLDELLVSNQEFLDQHLPDVDRILEANLEHAIKNSDLVIVGQKRPEFAEAIRALRGPVVVLDLVGLDGVSNLPTGVAYQGISW